MKNVNSYVKRKHFGFFTVLLLLMTTVLPACNGTKNPAPVTPSATANSQISASADVPVSQHAASDESGKDLPADDTDITVPEPEADAGPAPAGDGYDAMIAKMTLREKVGMLFMIKPEALENKTVKQCTALNDTMRKNYEKYPAGGFILFNKNLKDEETLIKLTSDLHALGSDPLIAIDEEGGSIVRIAKNDAFDVEKFPDMQEIAATGDLNEAYRLGLTIGGYLKKYGIDADFAPVADVNTNPDNPIIGKRAFGDDPVLAAKMVSKVISGLHDAGVMSCIKHFPGHGDTNTDSHLGYAETLKTWEEIDNCEMIPFKAGIEAGTDMVMVAHISAENVTGDDTPASLSYTIVTEKLRNELGFDGVVITDGMDMQAITDKYGSDRAAVLAISAGVDIILIPTDYFKTFDALVNAVETGEISEKRIDESVRRILLMKDGAQ